MKRKPTLNLETAVRAFQRGDFATAADLAHRLIRKKSSQVGAHRILASISVRNGNLALAITHLTNAAALAPDNVLAHTELGRAHLLAGDRQRAILAFEKAVSLAPTDPETHLLLAEAHSAQHEYISARRVLEHALESVSEIDADRIRIPLARAAASAGALIRAEDLLRDAVERSDAREELELRVSLGNVLRESGQLEKALEQYNHVIAVDPDDASAIAGRIEVHDSLSEFEEAATLLSMHTGSDREPDDQIALAFARIATRIDMVDEAIEYVERTLEANTRVPARESMLLFALGALQERAEAHDEAFDAWRRANRIMGSRFNEDSYIQSVDVMMQVFSRDNMPMLPLAHATERPPVYIVGMMRSGSSLLEQMLSCHSKVTAGGELGLIPKCAGLLTQEFAPAAPFPLALHHIEDDRMEQIADHIRQEMDAIDADTPIRTDKLPLNYVYLGFISRLFPNAKIIHCERHPLDVGLSCFATALLPIHRYANDLRHIGIVYRQYRRLMRHWREVLSLDILDVSYTSLVRHPERTLRNVLEFLDLEWDPACLAYHEHTRITKTASIDQVRRPIYSSSIQRYKRFEKHLGPLKSALGDLADFDDQTQRESTS